MQRLKFKCKSKGLKNSQDALQEKNKEREHNKPDREIKTDKYMGRQTNQNGIMIPGYIVITELEIKTIRGHHFTPIQLAKIKKSENSKC